MTFMGAAMFQWINVKGWVMVIGTITAYAAIAGFPWNIVIQIARLLLLGALSLLGLGAVRHRAAAAAKSPPRSGPSTSSWRCCCWPPSIRSSGAMMPQRAIRRGFHSRHQPP